MPVFQNVDTGRLLPPVDAARTAFDDLKMEELICSVRALGILQPLLVELEGKKFRVHAGHRRMLAATTLMMPTVPCMVFQPGECTGEAIKHHENAIREDLNAADEALHFSRLLDHNCSGDVDALCALVKETRGYVEGRLLLVQGWPQVFEALSLGLVSIGVAHELNRIDDEPTMLLYLDAAMRGGATVRMVTDWRIQWERTKQFSTPAPLDEPLAGAVIQERADTTMRCFLCEGEEDPHTMELLFAHKTCRRMLLDHFLARVRGVNQEEGA